MIAYDFDTFYPFNKNKISQENILYYNGYFAIACGYYKKPNDDIEKLCIGLRYTGEGDKTSIPYPQDTKGKHTPQWFILEVNSIEFLRSLIGQEYADDNRILQAIQTLTKQ